MRLTNKDFNSMMKNSHAKVLFDSGEVETKSKKRVESKKVIIDGIEFDSQNEGQIYWELKHNPDVVIKKLQPRFILQEKIVRDGKTIRAIKFKPDFWTIENSQDWITEVKSIGTIKANSKSYPMRRKLFLSKYPHLRYREIIFDGKKRIEKVY